jgi:hypothetical protein
MSGSIVSASINTLSSGSKVTIFDELEGIWGRLDSITEESSGWILADIEGSQVELPSTFSAILQPLIGQNVIVGLFDGEYHAGRCSA